MEEAWERAVEAAKGKEEAATTRSLTLDGSLKCIQGRLPPPPSLLEAFLQLQKLSIANVGLTSLVDFPRLPRLEVLNLSDNRIAGGLEHLVEAGLGALRELDLSNNKIQLLQDLAPLSKLGLVSLDLYQCPVTSISDYRVQVFRLIKNLQYLDKMDLENEEKPESDEEDEVSEDDASGDADADADGDGVDVEEDVVEGDSKGFRVSVDGEDDESEEDEGEENEELYEEDEDEEGSFQEVFAVSDQDGSGHAVEDIGSDEEDVEDDDEDDDDDDDEDEDDVENIEVHDVEESDEEEAGDGSDGEGGDKDEDDDEEGVEEYVAEPSSRGEVELEVVDHDPEDDENGELGEEDDEEADGVDSDKENDEGDEDVEEEDEEDEEDDDEVEEDYGTEYLIQVPEGQPEDDEGASDFEPGENEEENDDDLEDKDEDEDEDQKAAPAFKRKWDGDDELEKNQRPRKH